MLRTYFTASANIIAACALATLAAGCVINFKNPTPQRELVHVDAAYRYPGRCEFNSAEKYYKKEIQKGRFARTDLTLDPGQQLLVMNKAIVLHFYSMPDTFHAIGSTNGTAQMQYLRVWADTLDKTVYWNGSLDSVQAGTFQLKELVEYVDSIVTSSDAYQSLPKSSLIDN